MSMRFVLLVMLLAAPASRAANVRLSLGADYWVEPQRAVFPLLIGVGAPLGRSVELGGRFGAMLATSPTKVGVPLDFFLRIVPASTPLYIEGLAGPWLLFDEGDLVRAHAAIGFGVRTGGLSVGLEAGYLAPSGILGFRLGFEL